MTSKTRDDSTATSTSAATSTADGHTVQVPQPQDPAPGHEPIVPSVKRVITALDDGTYSLEEDGVKRPDIICTTRLEAGYKKRDLDDADRAAQLVVLADKDQEKRRQRERGELPSDTSHLSRRERRELEAASAGHSTGSSRSH